MSGQASRAQRRIVSVWLPSLAIERWWAQQARTHSAPPDDLPVLLAIDGSHGPIIHGLSRAAASRGARIGQRVVDARAAAPDLVVEWADPEGDAAYLERLMGWSRRWSPFVTTDPVHGPGEGGLVLDSTGCAHLFGGEAALLADIEARLSGLGLSSRLALAPSRGAAWALSRHGAVRALCDELRMLDPLPVAALRLPPDTVQTLSRLGLKTIGQLRALPRPALMRRFSRLPPEINPLIRLDQALGLLPEPVAPTQAHVAPRAVLRLAEPAQDPVPLLPDLARLLARQLDRAGEGTRRLRLTLCRTDGTVAQAEAGLARPTRDAAHMVRLFDGRLDGLDPGFGFDAVILEAGGTERLDAAQPDLTGKVDEAEALAHLIDRLSARLGPRSVSRATVKDSHIPERAEHWGAALHHGEETEGLARPPRPPVLLDPPEEVRVLYAVPEGPPVRLEWRRKRLDVTRYAGPERIAPEWWADKPGTRLRDYFRIEGSDGGRYWLYREGLAGDGRGGAPRWFLHGLFP